MTAQAAGLPAHYFTDSVLNLEHLSKGTAFPLLAAWEAGDGAWGIKVSLCSAIESPTAEQVTSIEGTLAEVLASVRLQLQFIMQTDESHELCHTRMRADFIRDRSQNRLENQNQASRTTV